MFLLLFDLNRCCFVHSDLFFSLETLIGFPAWLRLYVYGIVSGFNCLFKSLLQILEKITSHNFHNSHSLVFITFMGSALIDFCSTISGEVRGGIMIIVFLTWCRNELISKEDVNVLHVEFYYITFVIFFHHLYTNHENFPDYFRQSKLTLSEWLPPVVQSLCLICLIVESKGSRISRLTCLCYCLRISVYFIRCNISWIPNSQDIQEVLDFIDFHDILSVCTSAHQVRTTWTNTTEGTVRKKCQVKGKGMFVFPAWRHQRRSQLMISRHWVKVKSEMRFVSRNSLPFESECHFMQEVSPFGRQKHSKAGLFPPDRHESLIEIRIPCFLEWHRELIKTT
jgi:hypothetical protein